MSTLVSSKRRPSVTILQKKSDVTSSSSNSLSDEGKVSADPSIIFPWSTKSGQVAPSAICSQRRHSAVIITANHLDQGAANAYFRSCSHLEQGRPNIIMTRRVNSGSSDGSTVETTVSKRSSFASRTKSNEKFKEALADSPCNPCRLNKIPSPPSSLRLDAWAEVDASTFQVRGRNYLRDHKKYASPSSVFKLLTVDLVQADQPIRTGLCTHPNERIQIALRREAATGQRHLPDFVFAVNLCVPGRGSTYHCVVYFGLMEDISILQATDTPFGRLASEFFFGESDEVRDRLFKLIPRIAEGNFVVKRAVGTKPTILGSKVQQKFVRTDRFLEVMVDIASDPIAQAIVKLALGCSKSIVVDMAFVLEGASEPTLPERVLGAIQFRNLEFGTKDGLRRCEAPDPL